MLFHGLVENKSATSPTYNNAATISITKNTTTLYAIWKERTGTICDYCGTSFDEPTQTNGIYYISNKAKLIWFIQYVNKGNKNANAILTANIDMGDYAWTPIGSTGLYYNTTSYSDTGYTGTFDGNGYVIKNLTVTGSTTADASFGLFGTLSGSKVENCYVSGVNINTKVNTTNGVAGGIAGCNYSGTVCSSYAYNVTISAGRDGGIVGDNQGDISSSDRKGTLINCYTNYSKLYHSDRPGTTSGCGILSDAQFQSGEAA